MPARTISRWLLSAVATVASAYTLEATATAAGAALVFSLWLDAAGQGHLLALLAASYLIWAVGLGVTLGANWALLQATGVSPSVPSLAAYELVRRRSGSPRVQRIAADVGYVGTELVKEAPYYVAAFGAAALSDGLTMRDALIFLIGTNLGAGAYECALGISVRLGLRSHTPRT
jgi:hypothetical protein